MASNKNAELIAETAVLEEQLAALQKAFVEDYGHSPHDVTYSSDEEGENLSSEIVPSNDCVSPAKLTILAVEAMLTHDDIGALVRRHLDRETLYNLTFGPDHNQGSILIIANDEIEVRKKALQSEELRFHCAEFLHMATFTDEDQEIYEMFMYHVRCKSGSKDVKKIKTLADIGKDNRWDMSQSDKSTERIEAHKYFDRVFELFVEHRCWVGGFDDIIV